MSSVMRIGHLSGSVPSVSQKNASACSVLAHCRSPPGAGYSSYGSHRPLLLALAHSLSHAVCRTMSQ